jgi:hypothetical protein
MKEEKEKWEKIIHSKLYDFEVNASPDDWDIILGKLSTGKSVRLLPYRRYGYMAAAAAIAALLILGGRYFYPYNDHAPEAVGVIDDNSGTDAIVKKPADNMVEKQIDDMIETKRLVAKASHTTIEQPASLRHPRKVHLVQPDTITSQDVPMQVKSLETDEADSVVRDMINVELVKLDYRNKEYIQEFENTKYETTFYEEPFLADASSEVKPRRWGFGMGGGSYAVNPVSGNVMSSGASSLRSSDDYIRDKEIMKIKEEGFMKLRNHSEEAGILDSDYGIKTRPYETPSGNIKHKTPISVGLGVSYYLNSRWSLQSGVTYTILRSEWNLNNIAGDLEECKQNLHYIGVPLSISYRIAEWNRFQLYASTGGMCEFNIAGMYKESITSENLKITNSEYLRMKEPVWSVNARTGINYPLWKFINVYAEAGASYYFDNKSEIKTIRSDKPFNVSLQAGIRFGF